MARLLKNCATLALLWMVKRETGHGRLLAMRFLDIGIFALKVDLVNARTCF
jgi:hypothetical protein